MRLWLLLMCLSIPSLADAATRWASTSNTAGSCAAATSETDPGVYRTPAQLITDGCVASGDTVMFKAGTYTAWVNFNNLLPTGSVSAQTVARCEGSRTCILQPTSVGDSAVITLTNKSYITIQDFKTDGSSSTTAQGIYLQLTTNSFFTTIKLIGNHITKNNSNGIGMRFWNGTYYYQNLTITDNIVDDWGTPYTGGGTPHPLYLTASNALVERNQFTNPTTAGSYAIHCYRACVNNTIRYNDITGVGSQTHGMLLMADSSIPATGNLVYGNILHHNTGAGSDCFRLWSDLGTSKMYNNVCHNYTTFLNNRNGTDPGNEFSNNVCVTGTACTITDEAGSSSMTRVTNLTGVATSNFTNAAGNDYSLVAGASTLINSCTNVGLPYNGSAPDCGAFETFVFASCAVESGTPSVVNITFENNVYPPLQITDATGLSARENAVAKTNSSAVINGTNQVDLTVTAAFSSATSVDISASGTNITDSALIGGTLNQPYVQTLTNQACANNVSGGPAYTWTQSRYGFYALRGTESGTSKLPASGSADNTNKTIMVGGAIAVRMKMNCTGADCPADGFILRYSKNGGAYTVVPDAFGADNIAYYTTNDPDVVAQGTGTTERLTSDYATNVTGSVTRTANAIPSVDLSQDSEIELLYFVHLDTDATAGDTYAFRLYRQGGDTITYSQTPTMTVVPVSAGGGP